MMYLGISRLPIREQRGSCLLSTYYTIPVARKWFLRKEAQAGPATLRNIASSPPYLNLPHKPKAPSLSWNVLS